MFGVLDLTHFDKASIRSCFLQADIILFTLYFREYPEIDMNILS